MWGGIKQFFKESLFPVFCLECGKEGDWWCKDCLKKEKVGIFCCPVCHKETANGKTCLECQAATFLDGMVAVFNYEDSSPVSQLVHHFKYSFAVDIQLLWAKVIAISFSSIFQSLVQDRLVVPVPLYSKRKRERGFNQSEIIARIIKENGQTCGVEYGEYLQRTKPTTQQVKLTKEERERNVYNAFSIIPTALHKKQIVLVDDVFTTGATMNECARVLKENGAQEVWGFALARGKG